MKYNERQVKALMSNTIMAVTVSLAFFDGVYFGTKIRNKQVKKTEEIMALQQEIFGLFNDRDVLKSGEDFEKLIEEKIEFLKMVYLDAGYKLQ